MKNWIRVFVALGILVGLTTYTAYRKKQTFLENEKADREKQLVREDEADVTKVVIQQGNEKIVLERRKKNEAGQYDDQWNPLTIEDSDISPWRITEPLNYLADASMVKDLLGDLTVLETEKTISEKGERPEEYNLANPPVQIRLFTNSKDKPAIHLNVGDENSAKSGLYMQKVGTPEIVLAGNSINYLKDRPVSEWRRKKIVGVADTNAINAFEIKRMNGGKTERLRGEKIGLEWRLVAPLNLPLDRVNVNKLFRAINALRATKFQSENFKSDLKKYGFVPTQAELVLEIVSGKSKEKRMLLMGGKSSEGEIYFARGDYPQIFATKLDAEKGIFVGIDELVVTKPLEMAKGDVKKIEIHHKGRHEVIEKDGEKWKVKEPKVDDVNVEELDSFMTQATNLRAEKYLGMRAPSGFTGEMTTISLEGKDGVKTVAFRKVGEVVLGKWENEGLFFEFRPSTFDAIVAKMELIRERRLTLHEEEELAKVAFHQGASQISFVQKKDGIWETGPITGVEGLQKVKVAKRTTAESFLSAAKRIRIKDFTDDLDAETLGKGKAELAFETKAGEKDVWFIGDQKKDGYLFWSKKRKSVGVVDANMVDELRNLLAFTETKEGK